jgi:squalene-hopene/tetraprenyl-beta-curcumene cyclase
MRAHRLFFGLRLTLCICALASGTQGQGVAEIPDPVHLRQSIDKGLNFIITRGDAWMQDKNCNSCHHLPEMLAAHRAAKSRGFAVDDAKFTEWLGWAEPKVKDTRAGLEGVAFMVLAMPHAPPDAAGSLKAILEAQQEDGSWKPAGQLGTMQRRSADEAREDATRLHLLALDVLDSKGAVSVDARAKAAKWVTREESPTALETCVYRARYAQRFGKAEDAAALRGAIIRRQNADGGWAWLIGETQSDPLATGQVLQLLAEHAGSDKDASIAVSRARRWLLSSQRDDGSWPIEPTKISKMDRSDPKKANSLKNVTEIYTFWGTAWATIGLLETMPSGMP